MDQRRRREGLGRNRRGPRRRGTGPLWVGVTAMLIGSWFAYDYFTEPHRVFAKKVLSCDPWDVTWTVGDRKDTIVGCGRSADALCDDEACIEPPPPQDLLMPQP